jgi:hypothetical protein
MLIYFPFFAGFYPLHVWYIAVQGFFSHFAFCIQTLTIQSMYLLLLVLSLGVHCSGSSTSSQSGNFHLVLAT